MGHPHEQRTTAALALALLCELDPGMEGKAYYRECVRAALIRWQLSLTGGGKPAARSLARAGRACAATVGAVIELLSESARFQRPELLEDVHRHCAWLARLSVGAGRDEAALVHALISGAALVRDAQLLSIGRRRLQALLDSQSPEGWFPEGDGRLDVTRLPLLFVRLAKVYAHTRWEILREPLRRAVEFLSCAAPPGFASNRWEGGFESVSIGACGYELLAATHAGSAYLARLVRRQCSAPNPWAGTSCTDLMAAALCAELAMAAESPAAELTSSVDAGCPVGGAVHFREGGVSIYDRPGYRAIVDVRRGGALRVWWRNGEPPLDDGGIIAVWSRSYGFSSEAHRGLRQRQADNACATAGNLRHRFPTGEQRGLNSSVIPAPARAACRLVLSNLRNGVARLLARLRACLSAASRGQTYRYGERFSRVILFGDDTVRVRDRIRSRTPSLSLICQDRPPAEGHEIAPLSRRPPLYYAGGRRTQIDRTYGRDERTSPQRSEPKGGQSKRIGNNE